MKQLFKTLIFTLLIFASAMPFAQELTEASVQTLLTEVDKAIASKNVTMLANYLSDSAEFAGVLYVNGKSQTYHFKKPEYVKMLRTTWPLISNYKYKRNNQTIVFKDGKAIITADIVESMIVRGSYASYRTHETATVELVEGAPKLTKATASSSL